MEVPSVVTYFSFGIDRLSAAKQKGYHMLFAALGRVGGWPGLDGGVA